ncbi:MAG: hypothetical protein ABSB94_21130, partial [Syntrophorhabdales bacterium]
INGHGLTRVSRPDAKAPGRVAPPSDAAVGVQLSKNGAASGIARNRLKRAGLCHLFRASQNDCPA